MSPTLSTDITNPSWWHSNPQDAYRDLLAHDGLWRDERSGIYVAARHSDVLAAERDDETFASRIGDVAEYRLRSSHEEHTMIGKNDPDHLTQRRIINRKFTPRAVRSHVDRYQEIVDDIVDAAIKENASTGSVEVVDAWAAQLPCRVTADLIGFGEDRWRYVKVWSEQQMRIDMRLDDDVIQAGLVESGEQMVEHMRACLPDLLAEPKDTLFNDWMAEGLDGLTMVHETSLMIAGGAETTRTVISHGLRKLIDHPEIWEFLAEDPERVTLAVEELIRWVTPLNNMFRIATKDTELGGTTLNRGDKVMLMYPAANRDPRVFDEPDQFDVTRDPNPHLAFGHGAHFCLGANVARQELRMLFETLTQRITNLAVITEPDVEHNLFARAVKSFSISFDIR
jgi:cytochrome P450 family 142 subfamily A polypeptide 1